MTTENEPPGAEDSRISPEARGILFIPASPTLPDGRFAGMSPERGSGYWGRHYLVVCGTKIVAAYDSFYFPSVKEAVADLLARIESGEIDILGDFAVWGHERLMAVVHQRVDSEVRDMTIFGDPRNDIAQPGQYLAGWPTRKQWIEAGRGQLWFDRDNPKNPTDGEHRYFDEEDEPHVLGE